MTYAIAHIVNGVVENTSVWDAMPTDPNMVDITNQPQVGIGWQYINGTFSAPVITAAPLKTQAQVALDRITGARGTIIRCTVAGVAVPPEWKVYIQALRNIVNGTDTTSTTLPTEPLYPAGT